ncbi:MAG TPA: hypothetical protein VHB51_02175 [Candidatus Saccharimonadales bacterium]|nr:hypothetical protein [Candidatus Saccharimonadales bacterium]
MEQRVIDLANFDETIVVNPDDRYYPYREIAARLNLLKQSAQGVIDNPGFWDEQPESIRSNMVQWLDGLMTTLGSIVEHRSDPAWLGQNYQQTQSSITSYYDSLYQPFIVGIREFMSTSGMTRQELNETIRRVRTVAKEIEAKSKVVEDATSLITDLAAETSSGKLSEYFRYQVTGFPRTVYDRKPWYKVPFRWAKSQLRTSWYAERGYVASVRFWFLMVIASVVVTALVASHALNGVDLSKITLNEVFARALLVAAPAYAIRFSTRNFNASKHQVTLNRDKEIILDTVIAFLSREEIEAETRQKIIVEAAKQVFDPGDSGYLSRRDTSGVSDSVFEFPTPTLPKS